MNSKIHIDSCMIENSEAIMSDVFYEPVYVAKGNNQIFPIVKIKMDFTVIIVLTKLYP